MSKHDLKALEAAISHGAHGKRFTEGEEQVIIDTLESAKQAGEKISYATVVNAVKEYNHANGQEARKRAAVVNAITRLAKKDRCDDSVISKETNGREPYTEKENEVLIDCLTKAKDAKKAVSLAELHTALKESGVSPKERSLPSVRAHLTNMFNKANKEDEGQSEAETEIEEEESELA